jgi:hypothetical protein
MLTITKSPLEQRLADLGFVTYDEYLESSYWMDARLRWEDAGMPEECLICHQRDYNLHHRSYELVGEEPVGHLVALCEPHHYEVHRLLKKERPEVTLWNAHLYYRHEHFARHGKQPRLIGEVLAEEVERLVELNR